MSSALAGKRVIVTAGPTLEPIDPVRVVTNSSSGKMGYAIAAAAQRAGAEVTLVSGPTALRAPVGVSMVQIETAEELSQLADMLDQLGLLRSQHHEDRVDGNT